MSQEVLTIMLVYRLQDLVDRGVPRLSGGRVPLAGHVASQLRILELWVAAAFGVFDPGQHYAQVVVDVEDLDHPTRPGYVYLTALVVDVVAVRRQIPWVDVTWVDI